MQFGMTRYSSVSSAVERIKKKQAKDRRFLKRMNDIIAVVKKGQPVTPIFRPDENPDYYNGGFQIADVTPAGTEIIAHLIENYCF
jgi:hypothetical protein